MSIRIPARIPSHLTDPQLIHALSRCVRDERGSTAVLVAHLAEMDARRLHLSLGFSSLFEYCCQVLRLSESATCKRIDVARVARRFPALLDRLADGALTLTSARLVGPHLTAENHGELIAAAAGLRKRAVEEMLARRFPKPDVATLVRKLPATAPALPLPAPPLETPDGTSPPAREAPGALLARVQSPPPRPPATPLSADRYQIRFTASAATWKKLQVARDLLRHTVPSGDVGEIFDRALTALIDDLARKKCGAVTKAAHGGRDSAARSRHVPAKVRRVVWTRDQGRCAFVGSSGRRCQERGRLEFHHVEPYAVGGSATVANIELRCRAHNSYEAVLCYGSNGNGSVSVVRERPAAYGLSVQGSTGPGAGSRRGAITSG